MYINNGLIMMTIWMDDKEATRNHILFAQMKLDLWVLL